MGIININIEELQNIFRVYPLNFLHWMLCLQGILKILGKLFPNDLGYMQYSMQIQESVFMSAARWTQLEKD